MLDLESELSDRPVFVTGADGFIGSHLVDTLVEMDANVHAFVRATSSGELKNIRQHGDDITLHRGDLRNKYSVDRALSAMQDYSDTLIFHLAAQAHVGESWERPYETIDTNVIGTLNLLQAIVDLDLDIHKFDTAGTSEEYGNVDPETRDNHEFTDDVIEGDRSLVWRQAENRMHAQNGLLVELLC
jgi:dTDP-glucose 4,6-dehydratase